MEVLNATITEAVITNGNHGVLMAHLGLDFGDSCQGFGGMSLYAPYGFSEGDHKGYAGFFIWRCLEIVGVHEWGRLVGKNVRAKRDGGLVVAIGNIIHDEWFFPKEELQGFKGGK